METEALRNAVTHSRSQLVVVKLGFDSEPNYFLLLAIVSPPPIFLIENGFNVFIK